TAMAPETTGEAIDVPQKPAAWAVSLTWPRLPVLQPGPPACGMRPPSQALPWAQLPETSKIAFCCVPEPVCSFVEPMANRFLASSGDPTEEGWHGPTGRSPLPFMIDHTLISDWLPGTSGLASRVTMSSCWVGMS